MSTKIGLWIDHRKAIVIAITEQGEKIEEIVSEVEKQLQRAGDRPLEGDYEVVQVPADDRRQRDFTKHLNIYYAAVITAIRDAESILIFGPGEAKGELKEQLEKNHLGEHIVDIETVDKMTNPQIAAKVRQYFAKEHSPTN
jgi:molybdopterin converting factor small subunit